VDFYKQKKQILLTGSSSLNLLDDTQEPLTGRKFVYTLLPLSLEEIYPNKNYLKILKKLKQLMIFGTYPEIVTQNSFQDKQDLLKELSASYIYKDILEFQKIKSPDVLVKLLKALPLQIGSQISYNELANTVGIDKKTIKKYIWLLEKNFVIFRLKPFTKNKRREISKLKKIYFYDNGIRNAIINNFNFLSQRQDVGALWKNFMITQRMKYRVYHKIKAEQYFWRTYNGNEINLIEEKTNKLKGYKFKWKDRKKTKKAVPWLDSYQIITKKYLKSFVF